MTMVEAMVKLSQRLLSTVGVDYMEEVCVLLFYRNTYLYSHRKRFEDDHQFISYKVFHTFPGLIVRKSSVSEYVSDIIANYKNFKIKTTKIAYKPKCVIYIDISKVNLPYSEYLI